MKALAVAGFVIAAIGVAVAAPVVAPHPAVDTPVARTPIVPPATGDTPMADRIATIGILNKRNGLSRELRLHPGQAVRLGDAVVRVKACETTADWEADKLTGAFVQVIVRGADDKWRKYFSGWLFRESPSLNVVQHPIYDVWAKDCTMRHADVGPDTVVIDDGAAPGSVGKRSIAKKSADEADVGDPGVGDTADASNAI